jgi:hypothetical protein
MHVMHAERPPSVALTRQFMWQDDIVGVANFVRDYFDFMHAPDDDDASSNQP